MPRALLSFAAATNPVSLLGHLLAHRAAGTEIFLSRGTEDIENGIGQYESVTEIDNPDLLKWVQGWDDFRALGDELVPQNLPLALRLLKFAIQEGHVQRLPPMRPLQPEELLEWNRKMSDADSARSREVLSDQFKMELAARAREAYGGAEKEDEEKLPRWAHEHFREQYYGISSGASFFSPAPGPSAYKIDIRLAVREGYQLASGSVSPGSIWHRMAKDRSVLFGSGTLQASLRHLDGCSFDSYRRLIESRDVLSEFARAHETALQEADHRNACLLWFPEALLDGITAGGYSYIKMLFKIVSKR